VHACIGIGVCAAYGLRKGLRFAFVVRSRISAFLSVAIDRGRRGSHSIRGHRRALVKCHIAYKPLQDCDYRQKESLTKQSFSKVPIVYISYMGYSKFYNALLAFKESCDFFAYFNAMIYNEYEFLETP
jgi:hypothetical protein